MALATYAAYAALLREQGQVIPQMHNAELCWAEDQGCWGMCAHGMLVNALRPDVMQQTQREGVESSARHGWPVPRGRFLRLDCLTKDHPLLDRRVQCPEGCDLLGTWPVEAMMEHVNDAHGWTIDKVADWMEGLDAS